MRQMPPAGNLLKRIVSAVPALFILALTLLPSPGSAFAAGELQLGEESLLAAYHRIEADLARTSLGFPLYLESSEQNGRLHAEVYGIFDHPFDGILEVLMIPANWCDIASLHPNVKACTYGESPATRNLTFYLGRNFYQPPADTHQFTYHYRRIERRQGYLDIFLSADEGPFGTKDHRMRLEAIPLDGGRTFVRVGYS